MKKVAVGLFAAMLWLTAAHAETPQARAYWARGANYSCLGLQAAQLNARIGDAGPLFRMRAYMASYLIHFYPHLAAHVRFAGQMMHSVEVECDNLPEPLAIQTMLKSLLDAEIDTLKAYAAQ